MKKFFSIAIGFFLAITSLLGTEAKLAFVYEEAGARAGTAHYIFKMDQNGVLKITSESLPITPKGLTKRIHRVNLTTSQKEEILRLAAQATDFNSGEPNLLPDGMWAKMELFTTPIPIKHGSGLINSWEGHPLTEKLVTKLKCYLPDFMRELPM